MPKITDQDVLTATSNGDGTHSGLKLAQWLYEATTGKPLSDEDARKLLDEAKARAAARIAEREGRSR